MEKRRKWLSQVVVKSGLSKEKIKKAPSFLGAAEYRLLNLFLLSLLQFICFIPNNNDIL